MAGHSQFKNIMHRKGAQDARRARQFARLIREITVAARHGLPDPASNPRLRAAVAAAREANMPKDTVDRAIRKATELVSPSAPPNLLNAARTSEAVRLRLSVSASMMTATPAGP